MKKITYKIWDLVIRKYDYYGVRKKKKKIYQLEL